MKSDETAKRGFRVRGEDRRRQEIPVAIDRRRGPRRTEGRDRRSELIDELMGALGRLEDVIAGAESGLALAAAERDPDEVTQIPTRSEPLAGSVRELATAQAALLEFVRAMAESSHFTATLRARLQSVALRAGEVERRLALHMAERLGIDPPESAPRARRFTEKIARLLG